MKFKNFVFFVLAAAVLFVGCSPAESADRKAPDFSLQNITNNTVRLSDYEGKVIILNFFATWCPPCRDEIPDFVKLFDEYGDKNLAIIGISTERGQADTVKSFASLYGINYPVLIDDGFVSREYGPIVSIPTTFIVDKNGNIAEKIIGRRRKDYFENIIKPLL